MFIDNQQSKMLYSSLRKRNLDHEVLGALNISLLKELTVI
jgi:hypothetical protein